VTDDLRQILDALGPSLRAARSPLCIEGHTCDLPINTARFPSNWELSAQRATNVMVYLIRKHRIGPEHICAVGYADTRPLTADRSRAARKRNRRVDIVVLSDQGAASRRPGVDEPVQMKQDIPSMGFGPVRLVPEIDLRTRYYQHTGRRAVDTPAGN
jgi:hypothetical protein